MPSVFSVSNNCFRGKIFKTSLFDNGKTALCNFQIKNGIEI